MKLDPSELYLKQYPDVRSAIDAGGVESALDHYLLYGRAEGRIWPEGNTDPVRVAEPKATFQPPPGLAHACEDIGISKDLVSVGGWVDDRYDPLIGLTLIVGDELVALHVGRRRRADVDEHLDAVTPHEFGYWAIGCPGRPALSGAPRLRMLLSSGGAVEVTPGAVTRFATKDLFDTVLAEFGERSVVGSVSARSFTDLGGGAADVLAKAYDAVRSTRGARSICNYGKRAGTPLVTFVCVLFGLPFLLFQQVARFAQCSDLGQIEFVFVSNSPELEEPLNRDAEIAAWLFDTDVSIVTMNQNTGFGHANNFGVEQARGGRIGVINPDVFPVDAASVRDTLAMDDTALGRNIVGGRLYYADGTVMHEGMYFERDEKLSGMAGVGVWTVEHWRKGFPDRPRAAATRVDAVSGALMLMTRATYDRLGGFNEDFVYGHYEDADLCLRNERDGGAAMYQPDLRYWHYEGMGSVRRPEHLGSGHYNRWLFSKLWSAELGSRAARIAA